MGSHRDFCSWMEMGQKGSKRIQFRLKFRACTSNPPFCIVLSPLNMWHQGLVTTANARHIMLYHVILCYPQMIVRYFKAAWQGLKVWKLSLHRLQKRSSAELKARKIQLHSAEKEDTDFRCLRAYFWANEWTILSTARPGKANSLDPAFAPARICCRLRTGLRHMAGF